jgi:hypothetical protein
MILLILANVFVYLDLQGGDTEVEMEGALGRGLFLVTYLVAGFGAASARLRAVRQVMITLNGT